MDIMTVFDVVIVLFGVYMIGAAFKMKKTGEISSTVVPAEEIASCRDKKGFIAFLYWKEALFGGFLILVGILGVVNAQVISLGIFNYVAMLLFLATFIWFQYEMRRAREKFM